MRSDQAGALMRRARRLLRAKLLTHHQFCLLDCMMFACRAPQSDRLTVSYRRLAKLAGVARDTVRLGIARLQELGLVAKIKRRVRVVWGLGIASRQATNIYVVQVPDTETAGRPVDKGQVKKGSRAIEEALLRLGGAIGRRAVPAAACLPGAG